MYRQQHLFGQFAYEYVCEYEQTRVIFRDSVVFYSLLVPCTYGVHEARNTITECFLQKLTCEALVLPD